MYLINTQCISLSVDIFFFKQKSASEMRISDWSSDVCSSDLRLFQGRAGDLRQALRRRYSRGVAAPAGRALFLRGGDEADRGDGRLGKGHGGAEEAPRGAEGAPPGRQQIDRTSDV